MRCPFCDANRDRVVDSRESRDGAVIRRRRECLECNRRFTSYEQIEEVSYMVVKHDGRREEFSRKKLLEGLVTASRSTPTCVLVALPDEDDRAGAAEVAAALRGRGVPTEVSPTAQKYGKQIRYAERRGIPFVWFPQDDGTHQVRDIRTGEQVAVDPSAWVPPAEDLRPTVTGTAATDS